MFSSFTGCIALYTAQPFQQSRMWQTVQKPHPLIHAWRCLCTLSHHPPHRRSLHTQAAHTSNCLNFCSATGISVREILSLMHTRLLQVQVQVVLRLMKLTGDPNQLGNSTSRRVALSGCLHIHSKPLLKCMATWAQRCCFPCLHL